jgi:hypothetical protein
MGYLGPGAIELKAPPIAADSIGRSEILEAHFGVFPPALVRRV